MSNQNIFQDSVNNSYIIQINDSQNQPKQSNKDSNIINTPSFLIQTQKNLLNILSSFKFNNKQNSNQINQPQNQQLQQQNSEQNQKTPFSKSQKAQNYSQNRFLQQNFQQNSEKLTKNLIKSLNSPKLLINFLKNYDQEQYKQILDLTPQIVQEIEKVKKLVFYYFNLEKKSEKMFQNLQFNLQENLYGQFIFDKHLPQQVAPIVSKIFENQKILKIQAQLSSLEQYYKVFPVTKNIVEQALCPKVFQIILQQQEEIYRQFKVLDLYLGIKEALLKNSPYYKFLKFNNQFITSEQLNACQNFINEVDTYEEIQDFRFPYFSALLFRYLIQEKFIDRNQNNISSIELFYSECENFPVTNAVLDQINNTTYVTEKGVVGSFRKPKAKFTKQDNQFGSDNQILIGRLFKSQMDQVMNDICLNGSQISREHAQITYKDTLYDGIQPEFFEFLKGNKRCTIQQNHTDLDQWYFSLLKKTPIYTMYKYVLDRIDYNLPDSCQKDYRFSI
ncbi:SMAD/FHA domain [Pseudocohnilembus persalinus]|uniref:SMAD/FHA domain n=1 Tax=Pseudocohnilembus persalinus TaxID=266149 RepID=A0A0V0R499_PSEPJ|nr:SMAD/FHA domain [Pseudocohnilembus persalinus]|eukprot:KRX09061.1 SMAD/FHA domain [Pseudocohnilembus persalinus]